MTSHEIRTPITPMMGQLQMLTQGYFGKLSKKQQHALKIVLRNTTRLDRIIQDLLEVSRLESGNLIFNYKKVDLTKEIEDLLQEMSHFMEEKNIALVNQVGILPEIVTDSTRIMQVLRNLLSNAIKFSPEKSKIILRAEKKRGFLEFSVEDFGEGIPKKHRPHIFELFYQVEQDYIYKTEGTGLGLAISKGIVESQGGKIWLSSKLGKGSTFYFTLPLRPKEVIT